MTPPHPDTAALEKMLEELGDPKLIERYRIGKSLPVDETALRLIVALARWALEARGLLSEFQWMRCDMFCPVCTAARSQGHFDGCQIGKALSTFPKFP